MAFNIRMGLPEMEAFDCNPPTRSTTDALQVGARSVPLLMVHHPRARRYLLRLRPDGTVRVTIPRRGTISAARDFAMRNIGWLEHIPQLPAGHTGFLLEATGSYPNKIHGRPDARPATR
jgi:hypothetical protein